jgi:hypothetical protein
MAYKLFVNGDTLPASDLNNAFGASGWTAFTPTVGAGSLAVGTGGSLVGYYMQIGKTVFWRIRWTFGSSGRSFNDPQFNFPVTQSANYVDYSNMGTLAVRSAGGSSYLGTVVQNNGRIRGLVYAGGTGGALSGLTTTIPMGTATGDVFSLSGTYEAA